MRNQNQIIVLSLFCMLLMIFILPAVSQEDIETVDDSAFTKLTRPPVAFFHDDHNQTAGIDDCTVCHHMFENGKQLDDDDSVGMECSECHFADPGASVADLIRSYHLQCGGCHLKQKAGPVTCGECHHRE